MRLRWGMTIALVLFVGCSGRPGATAGPSTDPSADARRRQIVRIGLQVGVDRAELQAHAGYRVRGVDGLARTVRVPGPLVARVAGGALVVKDALGEFRTPQREIVLESSSTATWTVGGDRFDGDLVLRRNDDGSISVINRLAVEQYLRGVVPWEIGRPSEDALEAVKAQAIAARTYTYAHLDHWQEQGFDLYADTRDQVYRGLTGTAEICDRAIHETAHRVAVYGGELIRAYYSSTSGGFSSDLTDVWRKEGAPYLKAHRDARPDGTSWCADSPHFRWTETWSARELGEIVRKNLPTELGRALTPWDVGSLRRIEVVERDASGRVQRLRIVTDRDDFEVWGDRIRWVLRPAHSRFGILRSTMFSVENVERDGRLVGVVVRGGGFGHGVGLCQTGAIGRARGGQDAFTILRAYYPGIEIVDVRSRTVRPPSR